MVSGQNYPHKPIRIVASQPGAENDFAARVIAQGLAPRLQQEVVVENQPAGTGGAVIVLNSQRDGHTLLSVGSQFWIEPLLHETPYDAARDFAPVIAATNVPFVLYAHPALPANSVKEVIALAQARRENSNYGSGLSGASGHLAMELFKAMAGLDIARVSYKGGAAAMRGLVAGEVQLLFTSAHVGASHVRSGTVKAMGTASVRPSALYPGLPAIAETLPGYETKQVYGMLAPAGTPLPVVTQLNQEMARILNAPDITERFLAAGVEAVGGSPEDFAAFISAESAKWSTLIRNAGIRGE